MFQKIVPHLWYNNKVKEAVSLYISLFPESRIDNITTLTNTPSGDCDVVSFTLWNYSFQAINDGPHFSVNPSISLMINFDPSDNQSAEKQIDEIWNALIEGGHALMPLDEYPFSKRYGWLQDKYGLTWQLILTKPEGEKRPAIIPSFLFTNDVSGKANEATDYYLSVFKHSQRGLLTHYPPGLEYEPESNLMFTDFKLHNQWFVAMDSSNPGHTFSFNEGVSLVVYTDSTEETDYLWKKLSHVPQAEQCGWVKDRYGISWQIVPREFEYMMRTGSRMQIDKLTKAFMPMKKLDINKLKAVFNA